MTRLTSAVTASALIRLCQQTGGFGVVLSKGDPTSGAILLLIAERGVTVSVRERVLQGDGAYGWRDALEPRPNAESLARFLEKRQRFDPDLWLIELDVASAERFTAEIDRLD